MGSGRKIILADINSFCKDGVLTGHACAVAGNYVNIFRNHADIRIAGGPAFAVKFPELICLSYNTEAGDPSWRNKLRVLRNMWQLFRRCREDVIVLQSSAVATAFFGIAFFSARCTRVYMIQYNVEGLNSPVKRFLYHLASRKIKGIICPNADIGKAYGKPYCVVPDYIYTGEDALSPLPYDEKTYDFCMVGIICRDKGMVEAAARLAGTPHRVIIAGRPSDATIEKELRAIAAQAKNIELRLRFLDEAEYRDIIRSSRYCVLNYSGAYSEHSSGVVFDILFSGLPVIGRNCKSLRFIREYGMGMLFDTIDAWDVTQVPDRAAYNAYLQHIRQYYRTHEQHRQELVRFVTTSENC